jgi:hypothetical protein
MIPIRTPNFVDDHGRVVVGNDQISMIMEPGLATQP